MNHPDNRPDRGRVLVLAPTAADAAYTRSVLTEAGMACEFPADLPALCREFDAGVAAVLLTEEAVTTDDPDCLVRALRRQPPWSDVPVLFLTGHGTESPAAAWAMDLLGNVTILERPVRVTTLVSALRTALRARRRQYELRDRMETLSRQSERLRLLWEAASVLLSTEEPVAMMRDLFARIAPQFGLDAYFNYMVDEAGDALRMESSAGIPDDEAGKIHRLEFGQAVCGTVAQHRRPVVATHVQTSDDPKVQLIRGYGIRAYACNPLVAGGRLLGTLSFASRTRDEFEPDELEFFETVCHYVAYAYERLRLIRRLREEDRHKDEFLATLAHELRNPLAPIRNAEQFLYLKGPPDPDFQAAREVIRRQVAQLTRLVDDLLDVSRISRGKITLRRQRVDLGRALTTAVESVRPAVEAAGHDLTMSLPPQPVSVDGDPARLAQVFGNLLNNAAKYTDPGGRIRVTAEQRDDEVVVSVRDTGIGLAAEHLSRVFDMFSQAAPALERSQGGLGIGLSLVRTLVEMHGGRVEAHSEGVGRGSEFVVRLPLAAGAVVPAGDDGPRTNGNGHRPARRILVADDNVDAAESLAMMLSIMGHTVRTAHDGAAAVELADQFRPDLILLDIGMPRLNGYQAARRIRRMPWAESAVLAALTGWGQDADKHRAAEAGFDRHFTKPLDPDALEQLLAEMGPAAARWTARSLPSESNSPR
jgi:signal transduction histidine kinase/AmiR/NasT family two-component response regulator